MKLSTHASCSLHLKGQNANLFGQKVGLSAGQLNVFRPITATGLMGFSSVWNFMNVANV
jgi:hypothetical protein